MEYNFLQLEKSPILTRPWLFVYQKNNLWSSYHLPYLRYES